jgi:hypothetical protein
MRRSSATPCPCRNLSLRLSAAQAQQLDVVSDPPAQVGGVLAAQLVRASAIK